MRLLRIQGTVDNHLSDAAFNRLGWVGSVRRSMQTWIYRPDYPLRPLPEPMRLRLLLQDLGPTYVKIGQIISSQGRALPAEWDAELALLQSDVQPVPYSEVREVVIEELGAPPEELYVMYRKVHQILTARDLEVHRAYVGEYATSMEMAGVSFTLTNEVTPLMMLSAIAMLSLVLIFKIVVSS